jgi:tRNA A37 methylthiotransferase MiaB
MTDSEYEEIEREFKPLLDWMTVLVGDAIELSHHSKQCGSRANKMDLTVREWLTAEQLYYLWHRVKGLHL